MGSDDFIEQETMEGAPSIDDIITMEPLVDADYEDCSDDGNGQRFARLCRKIVRYVPDTNEWYVWNGICFELDIAGKRHELTVRVVDSVRDEALKKDNEGDTAARDRWLANAKRLKSRAGRDAMFAFVKSKPQIVRRVHEVNADNEAIIAVNGRIDLRTGELGSVRMRDMPTEHVAVRYNPDAKSGELNRYLDTFIPNPEDQRVLFGILGTALRGENVTRMLPMLLGPSTSGKSQLFSALKRLLRGYIAPINVSVFRGNFDDKPRPDMMSVLFRRIGYAMEASQDWELHADQAKRLTGRDTLLVRNLYAQPVEVTPKSTLIIVSNEMPRMKNADEAFKRRMITFPFTHPLPAGKEDNRIGERFANDAACLAAILARLVEGARDPMFRTGIRWDLLPERYRTANDAAFAELDHFDQWITWMKEEGKLREVDPSTPASHCPRTSELHEWYAWWVGKHGTHSDKLTQLGSKTFSQRLARTRPKGDSDGTRWLGWVLTEKRWL